MDVEAIERSTVEGVAPARLQAFDGWLVPLDGGAIGRAKSAVPLSHSVGPQAINDVEAAYYAQGLTPAFRIADVPGLKAVRDTLAQRRYAPRQPTMVEIGDVARLAAFRDLPGEIVPQPDAAWAAVFTGEGFDPADGAARVAALSRSPDAIYAAVRDGERVVAVGVATIGHGWAGIHGMRTALDRRGQGLASQVLTALGRAIQARGVGNVVLQVEEGNDARSLYRKAGFVPAWRYQYWRR